MTNKNSKIEGKSGFFKVFFEGDVGFWGKNGAWWVNLLSLGKIGKAKTFRLRHTRAGCAGMRDFFWFDGFGRIWYYVM